MNKGKHKIGKHCRNIGIQKVIRKTARRAENCQYTAGNGQCFYNNIQRLFKRIVFAYPHPDYKRIQNGKRSRLKQRKKSAEITGYNKNGQKKFKGSQVVFWDERLSTVAAERSLIAADVSRAKRRKVIDKMAAVFILQGYLDNLGMRVDAVPEEK